MNRRAVRRVFGEIALVEGRFDDAVADFTTVNELSDACATCGLARVAHAWQEQDQPDSALSVYERLITTHTDGLLADDDVRWLPLALRRLGELYEARGDTARAAQYYHEFVELWKDADPDLQPHVTDVRRRIATLLDEPAAGGSI